MPPFLCATACSLNPPRRFAIALRSRARNFSEEEDQGWARVKPERLRGDGEAAALRAGADRGASALIYFPLRTRA